MRTSPTAASLPALQDFLNESRQGFVIEPITLAGMPTWQVRDGALSHTSGGFFSIAGVEFKDPQGGPTRQGIYLYQPQSALTGLLSCKIGGQRHYLLQARAEPGNLGQAQYGPTVQSTPANYLRAHGGRATPYIDFFTRFQSGLRVLHDSMQLDLGERYLFKSKRLIIAECAADIALEPGFIWCPAALVNEAVAQSAFLNTDLRSLLALCDWDAPEAGALRPASTAVAASLRLPVRAERLAQVQALLQGRITAYRFRDLKQLDNWSVSEHGLREREPRQGFEIGYYQVQARWREVSAWQQPLINSGSEGQASLLCRLQDGALEVLVRVATETGLQTGKGLLPTYLRYPGAPVTQTPPTGQVLLQTTDSDEGGRFYRDASRYELRMNPDASLADGVWLRVSELKQLLANSNLCTIQLRCLSSLLLAPLPL